MRIEAVKHLFDEEYRCIQEKKEAEHNRRIQLETERPDSLQHRRNGTAIGCKIEEAILGKSIIMVHIHDGKILGVK